MFNIFIKKYFQYKTLTNKLVYERHAIYYNN